MKAVQMSEHGDPQVLQVVDVADPQPGPGQVLIRVRSAAVNFADTTRRAGRPYPFPTPLPFVPGFEVAGDVAALGDAVPGPPVGTPVFAVVGAGGYAQLAVAEQQQVIAIPPGVGTDQAAGLILAGATAMLMLTRSGRLASGESVFIPAAAGGVGSFAVQIARLLGAGRVIAGASSDSKRRAALDLGADHAVDYTRSDWPQTVRGLTGGAGVDVALEMTGGARLGQTLTTLAPFGRLLVFGAAGGVPGTLSPQATRELLYDPALNQTLTGFNIGPWFALRPADCSAALTELVSWVATGEITVPIGLTLPLEQAAQAHRLLETGSTTGKVILKP